MAIVWKCGKCEAVFIGSSMTAWCDCGNTRFRTGFEIDRDITVGTAIRPIGTQTTVFYVWCEKPLD